MRFSLSISHTPWVPERVESLARLKAQLGDLGKDGAFLLEDERAANHLWSLRMWERARSLGADWAVFIQDDTVLRALDPATTTGVDFLLAEELGRASAAGFRFVGLHVPHPAGPPLRGEGVTQMSTRDMIVGVAYAIKREALESFLTWRAQLPEGAVEGISEDTLVALFAAMNGGVWHPIPTAFDHDTALPSTYGHDSHKLRKSFVTFANAGEAAAAESDRIPHLGCFYGSTPGLLRSLGHPKEADEAEADTADRERRRIRYAQLGRGKIPAQRLLVCSPTRDQVGAAYAHSVWQLLREEAFDVSGDLEITNVQIWTSDVVRVRNRMAWHFLNRTDATHLLFIDDDIEFTPATIRGMLAANKGFVAAPYPQRNGVQWSRVAELLKEGAHIPLEAAAYKYNVRTLAAELHVDSATSCAEVEAIPLGCALIDREALTVVARKAGTYYDREVAAEVPDLFGLEYFTDADGKTCLMSEDYSFCLRWRERRNQVHMYLGPGSPVTHHGHHRYQGHIEAFNLRRV